MSLRRSRFDYPRIARVMSSEELGTMSKNNLRRMTLVRGPIWGIHSLTLIISWSASIAPRDSRFPTAGQGERRLWERD